MIRNILVVLCDQLRAQAGLPIDCNEFRRAKPVPAHYGYYWHDEA